MRFTWVKSNDLTAEEIGKMKKDCCTCKRFRMWKPSPSYCTKKKEAVNPLAENEPCYVLRKGLPFLRPVGEVNHVR
jgi:hypothetical protein